MSEKLYEYKTISFKGAKHYLIRIENKNIWKHHRWDGPAIVPFNKDSEFEKSYYLHGIPFNYDDYNELMKEREGLPWYKNPSMRGTSRL